MIELPELLSFGEARDYASRTDLFLWLGLLLNALLPLTGLVIAWTVQRPPESHHPAVGQLTLSLPVSPGCRERMEGERGGFMPPGGRCIRPMKETASDEHGRDGDDAQQLGRPSPAWPSPARDRSPSSSPG